MRYTAISGDKTAIYISHRLASCRFCDKIAVFHEGSVVQQGAHTDLVADENGKYYELWNAQAQYYTEKNAKYKGTSWGNSWLVPNFCHQSIIVQ